MISKRARKTQVILGLMVAVLAAVLMLTDVVNTAWGAAIGMIGVGLIAAGSSPADE